MPTHPKALAAAALRSRYRLPIIGVEPAVKPAALATHSGSIGVLATKATLASEKFLAGVENHVKSKGIKLLARSGSGLVELIENNQLYSKEMAALLDAHCAAFATAGIDQLVLGCTHYPYLRAQLAARLPQAPATPAAYSPLRNCSTRNRRIRRNTNGSARGIAAYWRNLYRAATA